MSVTVASNEFCSVPLPLLYTKIR